MDQELDKDPFVCILRLGLPNFSQTGQDLVLSVVTLLGSGRARI
jgi:hypothetical protein